jgi:hypothetical protein
VILGASEDLAMTKLWTRLKRWFASLGAHPAEADGVAEWRVEERKHCRIYRGNFVIYDAYGRVFYYVPGWIVEWQGLGTDVYLHDPPIELRHHAKGPCLQLVSPESPWFKLHWERPARDFNRSRAYVEQLLDEAFRRKRCHKTPPSGQCISQWKST